jgi:hypothetical protein
VPFSLSRQISCSTIEQRAAFSHTAKENFDICGFPFAACNPYRWLQFMAQNVA